MKNQMYLRSEVPIIREQTLELGNYLKTLFQTFKIALFF